MNLNFLYIIKKWNTAACVVILLCSMVPDVWGKSFSKRISPWVKNSFYWQYRGKPVLLLGASSDDNIYQWPKDRLIPHLDSLKLVGGNYLRNTMSERSDKGFEMKSFYQMDNGKFDLERWNKKYWDCFEFFLRETRKRDIIVQIEIWDRFDYSNEHWKSNPYNPKNNINYSFEESGFKPEYPQHSGANKQPFFFTVPKLKNNTTVLKYQQAFVTKVLSIVSKYNNVLICLDNETSGVVQWANYWEKFVHRFSEKLNVTEMWDDWNVKSDMHKRTIDHPEKYQFIDISQNSWKNGNNNWENAQYVFEYIRNNPRPVNSTKIYGNDIQGLIGRGTTTQHAVNTFCRNILGGFASSRFHRPTYGQGLNTVSMNCIRTVRKIETLVKMWEVEPNMQLLETGENSEIYICAEPCEKYVAYFAKGGKAKLDLKNTSGNFILMWINTENVQWRDKHELSGGAEIELDSKCNKSCFAVLVKKK